MTIKIEGLKELEKTLLGLEEKIRNRIKRGSIKKALTPIHDGVVGRAPVGETGNLADSFVLRVSKDGLYGTVITTKKGHHAHLVEFGHRVFQHGQDTGKHAPPYPFYRPVWDEKQEGVLQTMIAELKTSIEAAAKKSPGNKIK